MINKKAFTLTELLVALGIIGAVAAISIPGLINNMNKHIYTTKLKGTIQTFKQTIDAELLAKKTTTLELTDFRSPNLLFRNHFDTVKICGYDDSTCWPNMQYKTLNGGTYELVRQYTAKLRNGMTILYNWIESDQTFNGDTVYLEIFIDLNGSDRPNIVGRDFFQFYISTKGKITENTSLQALEDQEATEDSTGKALHLLRAQCLNGQPDRCYSSIIQNGWIMSY